jgi:hypothetical protein
MSLIETLAARDEQLDSDIKQKESEIRNNIRVNKIWEDDIITYKKERIEINVALISMGDNGPVKG